MTMLEEFSPTLAQPEWYFCIILNVNGRLGGNCDRSNNKNVVIVNPEAIQNENTRKTISRIFFKVNIHLVHNALVGPQRGPVFSSCIVSISAVGSH